MEASLIRWRPVELSEAETQLREEARELVVRLSLKSIPVEGIIESLDKRELRDYIDETEVRKLAREARVAAEMFPPHRDWTKIRLIGVIFVIFGIGGMTFGIWQLGLILFVTGLIFLLKPDTDGKQMSDDTWMFWRT